MAAPDREQRPPWHAAADLAPTRTALPRVWINLTRPQGGVALAGQMPGLGRVGGAARRPPCLVHRSASV